MYQYLFQVLLSIFWMYVSRSGIAESYDDSAFKFFEELHTIFDSGCTILQSYQQYTRIPIFPHYCQHLLFSLSLSFFCGSHIDGCKVVLMHYFSFGYASWLVGS